MAFSANLLLDLQQIFQYQFMQHAFEAGTLVAIVAGIVGYFVVLRRSSFAAHALSHIGFAGAAGAVLVGVSPVLGLLVFTSVGGMGMTILGPRASHRDVQIGTVLAFMLGLGVLFISLYTGYATEAYSILFGEILGISSVDVLVTAVAALVILCAVAFVYRPLLFVARRRRCGSERVAHAYARNRVHASGCTCHIDCRSSSRRTSNFLLDGDAGSDRTAPCQETLARRGTVSNHLLGCHMVGSFCSILRTLPREFLHNNHRVRPLLDC